MKKFEFPEIEIIELLVQDVVTTSGESSGEGDYIEPGPNEFPLS